MSTSNKKSFWYQNGLGIVFLTLFILTLLAQAITGFIEHNAELEQGKAAAITFATYLHSGHFISATFENFESEFLQMALYVILTVSLRQKGSAESKSLDGTEEVDREPQAGPDVPWPVRKGGIILKLYESSLFIAFLILFFISWGLHLYGSWVDHNEQNLLNGQPADSITNYLTQANFWFETFQNWQSEFLSIASIVIFTIFLRQKGSPESKPVDAPHSETGK
jgi:Na+-transporting methylmalonyl-CoA/oxaloacetate decarboxylase gamma subunit